MPFSQRHKQQRNKNLLLFAILLAIVAMFFLITTLKISGTI